jgi:hypothetical protein
LVETLGLHGERERWRKDRRKVTTGLRWKMAE